VIGTSQLPPAIRALAAPRGGVRITLDEHGLDLQAAVEEFQHRLIAEALRRTKGNKQAAARLLGLKRTTLVAKLRRCGMDDGDASGATA
jgi:DNA-binding NtrC family response regulator